MPLPFLRTLLSFARGKPKAPVGGEFGERRAAEHLQSKGLRILARNWRNPKDRREEIDLVCSDGPILVFVEVKARSASSKIPGYYAVTPKKKAILKRACRAYLYALPEVPRTYRFDIVEIGTRPAAAPIIHHFENVPLF